MPHWSSGIFSWPRLWGRSSAPKLERGGGHPDEASASASAAAAAEAGGGQGETAAVPHVIAVGNHYPVHDDELLVAQGELLVLVKKNAAGPGWCLVERPPEIAPDGTFDKPVRGKVPSRIIAPYRAKYPGASRKDK